MDQARWTFPHIRRKAIHHVFHGDRHKVYTVRGLLGGIRGSSSGCDRLDTIEKTPPSDIGLITNRHRATASPSEGSLFTQRAFKLRKRHVDIRIHILSRANIFHSNASSFSFQRDKRAIGILSD